MYMEQSITIRCGSLCICSLASSMQIIEIIAIFLIIVIICIKNHLSRGKTYINSLFSYASSILSLV